MHSTVFVVFKINKNTFKEIEKGLTDGKNFDIKGAPRKEMIRLYCREICREYLPAEALSNHQ